MKAVLSTIIVVVFVRVSEAVVCKTDADCGSGECCYIRPEFIIVSRKRQLSLPAMNHHNDTGVCEAYRNPHDQCGVFEKLNGHCGCLSGYSCQWVPDPTTTSAPVVRRKLPYHAEPGMCEAYRVKGEHCGPLEQMNGHCGCGSGLSCQWVPDPTTTTVPPIVRRMLPYHDGPGAYKCAERTLVAEK